LGSGCDTSIPFRTPTVGEEDADSEEATSNEEECRGPTSDELPQIKREPHADRENAGNEKQNNDDPVLDVDAKPDELFRHRCADELRSVTYRLNDTYNNPP
jgi:hypothetical protein